MLKQSAMLGRFRQVLLLLLCLPLLATAATDPKQVIQQTMNNLLQDLDTHREVYRKDSHALYNAIDRILVPVIDVNGISRSVMTVKYSHRATPEQMKRFSENFKNSLMQFYGNALLEYDRSDSVKILSSRIEDNDRATVGMQINGNNGVTYPVTATMVPSGDSWKLHNIIINGINIGKLFRDQFADAMNRNHNDLDKTINNWGAEVAKVKDSEAGQQAVGKK